jgi:hypothetical protein
MKFSIFYQLLKQQYGSEATQGLYQLFSLYDPTEARKSEDVFIDHLFANRALAKIKTTGARHVMVTTKIDPKTGKDFIDYIKWVAPAIGKMEVKL